MFVCLFFGLPTVHRPNQSYIIFSTGTYKDNWLPPNLLFCPNCLLFDPAEDQMIAFTAVKVPCGTIRGINTCLKIMMVGRRGVCKCLKDDGNPQWASWFDFCKYKWKQFGKKQKAFWYWMGEEGTLLMLIWGVLLHKQITDDVRPEWQNCWLPLWKDMKSVSPIRATFLVPWCQKPTGSLFSPSMLF